MNWYDEERNIIGRHENAHRQSLEHHKVVAVSPTAGMQFVRRAISGFGGRLVQWGFWLQNRTHVVPAGPVFPENRVNGRPC